LVPYHVLEKHVIDLPRRIVIGKGVLDSVGMHVKELGLGSTALIVSGPTSTRAVARRVSDSLTAFGVDVHSVAADDATVESANQVASIASEVKASIVVGVGGGKAIDVAKYAAHKIGGFFVSVPTAPSHDGIASPFASLKGFERPVSVRASTPALVVADTDVMRSASRRLILAGCGDLLGKFTAVLDWRLAHRLRGEYYGEYSASLALLAAKKVLSMGEELSKSDIPEDAVRTLVEALISSGIAMAIAGSTRPASGSEHLFAHALDVVANYPALHGEEVAVGTIMMLYLHGRSWRRVKNFMARIGLPTTAKDLGVRAEDVVKALTIAHTIRPERYTILGEKGLTPEAAERLARVTGVID